MISAQSISHVLPRNNGERIVINETGLFQNINKLHTTELGAIRIKRNLSLETEDVVA